MNPLGGLVALLGVVLILIGISGTQRNVAQALRGARPSGPGPGGTSPAAGGGTSSGPYNKGQQATQGGPGAIFGPAPVRPPIVAPPVQPSGGGLSA